MMNLYWIESVYDEKVKYDIIGIMIIKQSVYGIYIAQIYYEMVKKTKRLPEHQNLEVKYRIRDAKRLSSSYETKILSRQNSRLGPSTNGSPLAQTFFCIVCLSSFLALIKLSSFQNWASWLLIYSASSTSTARTES